MERKVYKLDFSGAEVSTPDYTISKYPGPVIVKMLMKANQLGLEGKKIEVVETKENFATGLRYIDFVVTNE